MKKDDQALQKVEQFFSQYQAFSFKADDLLLHRGTAVEFIYYLKSGVIKQSSISPQGDEVTITQYKSGAFFPLIWAIKETPMPYDFRAVTNGHGWKAPKDEVISYLKNNAEVTFDLAVRLLSGLEGMSRKVEFAFQATANLRVSEALLTLAYRFGKDEKKQVELDFAITHQELAEITGLTRETVSRELKILKEKGLITISEQMFTIVDLAELEKFVGFVS